MAAPITFNHGDMVLYRATPGEYNLAKVDLVRGAYLTAFPWSRSRSDWARGRSRILRSLVTVKLPRDCDAAAISDQLNRLANERDARRAKAAAKFERQVQDVAERALA